MKYSFYQLGQQWASNTGQTETPTAEEVRNHIQSTINFSAKRVKDKDVADFVLGAQSVIEEVPVVEEKPKRKYTKKAKAEEVETPEADLHIDADVSEETEEDAE